MRTLFIRTSLAALLLWALYITLFPVYGWLAYRGVAPMLPGKSWQLPASMPQQSMVASSHQALDQDALDLLSLHAKLIKAPAISAAVAIEGDLVWAGSVGWADIDKEIVATPDTIFRIGSSSKALTATLAARQVQADKLQLDSPIKTYLEVPEHWAALTPRQLLSHTAGMPHYGGTKNLRGKYHFMAMQRHFSTAQSTLGLFDDSPLLFEPGSQFRYSSLGTILLSAVMENIEDGSFADQINEQVFKPNGLSRTGLEENFKQDLAEFYWEGNGQYRPWRKLDQSQRLAAGGFVSTPSDLVKLGSLWFDNSFIDSDLRNEFWTPQVLGDGGINDQNYALGWRVHSFEKANGEILEHINHGGVSRGAQCWLMVVPEYKLVMAISTNRRTEEFWDFASVSQPLLELFTQETERALKD